MFWLNKLCVFQPISQLILVLWIWNLRLYAALEPGSCLTVKDQLYSSGLVTVLVENAEAPWVIYPINSVHWKYIGGDRMFCEHRDARGYWSEAILPIYSRLNVFTDFKIYKQSLGFQENNFIMSEEQCLFIPLNFILLKPLLAYFWEVRFQTKLTI